MEDHEHEYDYVNPEWENNIKHYPCKHNGCNMITSINQDGSWAFDDKDGREEVVRMDGNYLKDHF